MGATVVMTGRSGAGRGSAAGSGAGRTASGLSMLMSNAGKSIKQVIMYVDQDVIKATIHAHYEFNMLYDDDVTIKGK